MQTIKIENDDRHTVLKVLRQHLPNQPSWSAVRKLLSSRRVGIGGVLCLDESRRLARDEVITVRDQPFPAPPGDSDITIHYVDSDLVVVEKPSGMESLRRSTDLNWSWQKKNRQPTLDECVPRRIGQHAAAKKGTQAIHQKLPKLFPVHRIDRDSSGLLVFARNKDVQSRIIQQFAQHSAVRKYLAIIPEAIENQTVTSQLIRDRGDGLRGSTDDLTIGEYATTHFETIRTFQQTDQAGQKATYSELSCTLETGRTNQIRIHLAEMRHPICGDIKYRGPFGNSPLADSSRLTRLALHATRLTFKHPLSDRTMDFSTPWPKNVLWFFDDQ